MAVRPEYLPPDMTTWGPKPLERRPAPCAVCAFTPGNPYHEEAQSKRFLDSLMRGKHLQCQQDCRVLCEGAERFRDKNKENYIFKSAVSTREFVTQPDTQPLDNVKLGTYVRNAASRELYRVIGWTLTKKDATLKATFYKLQPLGRFGIDDYEVSAATIMEQWLITNPKNINHSIKAAPYMFSPGLHINAGEHGTLLESLTTRALPFLFKRQEGLIMEVLRGAVYLQMDRAYPKINARRLLASDDADFFHDIVIIMDALSTEGIPKWLTHQRPKCLRQHKRYR